MVFLRILIFALGTILVIRTVMSAIRNFVLPRGEPLLLSRLVFLGLRYLFMLRLRFGNSDYGKHDRAMAIYAPLALLVLAGTWLVLVAIGFTAMFWALENQGWRVAFTTSGSSLLTLGFQRPERISSITLSFVESALGFGLVALLISFLPSIYAAFARREVTVAMFEPLAGTPPTVKNLITRHYRVAGLDRLDDTWVRWREWFSDIEESHTTISALVFFRSPQPDRSWVTSAGCVLDSASFVTACLALPNSVNAQLCIRTGFISLRRISDFFSIQYPRDPQPGDPISITREEFDEVWENLAKIGVPLKSDRDQCWLDFAGWRVNYDAVLLALCALTMPPPTPWSSDRAPKFSRPPLSRLARRSTALYE